MLRKDYYLILGIPRSESAAGIRAAYRDLAKRHHPDVAGPSGAGQFREITEAYEVLSDPARRHQYNDYLAESERPLGTLHRPAEPIAPQPPSVFDRPESILPSFEELFDQYMRNFTGFGVPKAEREEGLNIEVVLTPEEASRGGVPVLGLFIIRLNLFDDMFRQDLCHVVQFHQMIQPLAALNVAIIHKLVRPVGMFGDVGKAHGTLIETP